MTNKIAVIEKEFNGAVYKFREDGYFNMTHAAKVYGKDTQAFFRNDSTKQYIDEISKVLGDVKSTPLQLVEIIPGNRYVPERGTWAHPKLAVFFARWLDVKFAVFCDMVIDDLISGHAHVVVTAPEKAVAHMLPQALSCNHSHQLDAQSCTTWQARMPPASGEGMPGIYASPLAPPQFG